MSRALIRSARHPKLQRLRELCRDGAARRESGLFVLEGPPAIRELLAAGGAIAEVLVSGRLESDEEGRDLLDRLAAAGIPATGVADAVLERAAPTEHGRGAVALVRLPEGASDPGRILRAEGPLLIALGVQDPGNVGSLVRTAEALGAAGLVADAAAADPWGPKAARASAGALARLPVARAGDPADLLRAARGAGRRVVAAVPRGGDPPSSLRGASRAALVVGAEGRGLPPEHLALADARVTIPLARPVDSLGVAAAAAILLYEATRKAE